MSILWNEDWNTGHTEIDQQHQRLIQIFNDLEKALLSDASDLDKSRNEALHNLVEYVDYHFKTEELLMKVHTYPEAAIHWRLHKDFKRNLFETVEKHKSGETILASQILLLLLNWLDEHIRVEDRKLGEFLKENQKMV